MRTLSLSRVLDRAVQYALLSSLVGCVAQGEGADGKSQNPADSQDEVGEGTDEPSATASEPSDATPDETAEPTDESEASDPPVLTETTDSETAAPQGSDPDSPVDPETEAETETEIDEDPATETDAPTDAPSETDTAPPEVEPSTDAGVDDTTDGFEVLSCSQDQPWDFANMNFAREVDFIALRAVYDLDETGVMELASHGQACLGEDAGVCAESLSAAAPQEDSEWRRCSQTCVQYALVTTEGSEVKLLQTKNEIKELLGEIDSLDEAVLWVQANNGEVHCNSASGRVTDAGYEVAHSLTLSECPVQMANVVDQIEADGTITELSREVQPETGVCVGRRPQGLLAVERADTGHPVGDYFAEVAQLEAAAVAAFDAIHAELCAFGAPEVLRHEARVARQDEARHTRQMDALARRYGGTPLYPASEPRPLRSLFDAARDNVIEGCVRETYGAACAKYQAQSARDPEVRRVLTQIAADETRHAELSWAMHAWFVQQLTQAQRADLERDYIQAIAQLRRESQQAVALEVSAFAGVPSAAHAGALLDALDTELWRLTRAA